MASFIKDTSVVTLSHIGTAATMIVAGIMTARYLAPYFGDRGFTGQEFPICTIAHTDRYPAIFGDILVWQGNRNSEDIFGINLIARQEFPICASTGNQDSPAIYGDIVIWSDVRNGNWAWDIYDYYIVRLNEDMISLAEKPRLVELDRKFGPAGEGRTDDKPSLHKRNGIYYLSWSSFYAMSRSLYGPYIYKGSVIVPDLLSPDFRKSDLWCDRHGNFFSWNNQWYYVCHDLRQPGNGRTACISYVHYRDNGEMAPVRLDKIGVGQYDPSRARIEAEDYFKAVGADIKEHPVGGFEVRNICNGSYLVYPKVMNLRQNTLISFQVSSNNPADGMIEVRENGPEGKILGSCQIPKDINKWDVYRTITCPLQNEAGTRDLCFIFKGSSEEMVRLDWFEFP